MRQICLAQFPMLRETLPNEPLVFKPSSWILLLATVVVENALVIELPHRCCTIFGGQRPLSRRFLELMGAHKLLTRSERLRLLGLRWSAYQGKEVPKPEVPLC